MWSVIVILEAERGNYFFYVTEVNSGSPVSLSVSDCYNETNEWPQITQGFLSVWTFKCVMGKNNSLEGLQNENTFLKKRALRSTISLQKHVDSKYTLFVSCQRVGREVSDWFNVLLFYLYKNLGFKLKALRFKSLQAKLCYPWTWI